jgi:two-component system sensor histidine kinase GlrK
MRTPRPRTLRGLILVGLALTVLPLLVAIGHAGLTLEQLSRQSEAAVLESVRATQENQRIVKQLTAMERNARQFLVLGDPTLLQIFLENHRQLQEALQTLSALPHDDVSHEALVRLQETAISLTRELQSDAPAFTPERLEGRFAALAGEANELARGMRLLIDNRLQTLAANASEAQTTIYWQAALLIPGIVAVLVFLSFFVMRPIRQIDGAISALGRGTFSRQIEVRGPSDLEQLGRQLEWLRVRLLELAQEKNRFLRHMSHELKTPLANIREGTELLLDGSVGSLDDGQEEVAKILRDNAVKLQRLIENLLSFSAWQSKSEILDLSAFDLKPLIGEVLRAHRLTLASQKLKLQLDIAPLRVVADRDKLRLVLENLLSNAIKFSPRHGVIHIRAQTEQGELVLDVADDGPGIPASERGRVFDAFYQGSQPQGTYVPGTGIGLSVVAECVAAHGGRIEVADGVFRGAHFRITLPLQQSSEGSLDRDGPARETARVASA